VLAIGSLGTYGVVLGGWSSNNKYSLLGGLRTSAQMLSYELPMGVALLGSHYDYQLPEADRNCRISEWLVWIYVGSSSSNRLLSSSFYISSLAEAGRAPFDLPETENELIAGFATEYGGMKFGLFFGAEYVHMIVVSFLMATLFLGGWAGPFVTQVPLLGVAVPAAESGRYHLSQCFGSGPALPRVRFDKLMKFNWKFLLPLSIANAVVTALVLAVLFF
jgi:NADH-quinone oxidoreductase subunit H